MDAYNSPTPTKWTEHIKDKGVALNFLLPIIAVALFPDKAAAEHPASACEPMHSLRRAIQNHR